MQRITAEDITIINRYQTGDKSAFDELVRKHQQRAYHYAFRLTNNADEAADVVAEAFVRVFRSLEGFKGDSSFTTWLYRIETNCFLDIRKREKARPAMSLEDANPLNDGRSEMTVIDDSESAQETVERRERISAIESAMAKLPDHQRTILMMYHAESLSYEEIAEALSLPIGTVKSRINRARLSLRDLLTPRRSLFSLPRLRQQNMANA